MNTIDIQKVSDDATFGWISRLVLGWCFLIIVFDGYDLAVVGIALPSIMKDMGVNPTSAGFMASSALFGMAFGNIFLGTIADRIGRRWAITLCIFLFSIFTAAAGLTKDPISFSVTRFFAGVGIGGVMPNVIAHMSEYSPKKIRSTMVTLMFSGYSIGGIVAALIGKGFIESHGWPSVFLAAATPLLLIPFILKTLPESMPFLLRAGRTKEISEIVAHLNPGYVPRSDDQFFISGTKQTEKISVGSLFSEGRTLSTLMFWTSCFMCLFMVYALSSWLTKLMASAGYSLGSALAFVIALNVGGMVGAVGGGWLADKFRIKYVMICMYVCAAVSITLLSYPMSTEMLYFMVGLAGASTIGTQIINSAYVSQYYPMTIRSTAVGFTLGFGRIGAISAPIIIGILVSLSLPLQTNFLVIAVPALIAATAIILINDRKSATKEILHNSHHNAS